MAVIDPLVSIVLPTYNRAHYLSQALMSCCQQTYQHWEVIVVDDASTDATPAVIAAYCQQDARIHSVRHETNQRLPQALNTGFAQTRGAFLTWTSDDDLFLPHTLERLVAAFSEYPAADFIYSDYSVIDENGAFVQINIAPAKDDLIFGKERVACFLYRRTIFEEVGDYATDLFLAEDYDYLLRILNSRFHIQPLHQNLYEYRRHAASLTDRYRGQTFRAAELALRRNRSAMWWATRVQRGEALLHLASLATWQRSYGRAVRYIPGGIVLAPGQAFRKMWTYGRKQLHL